MGRTDDWMGVVTKRDGITVNPSYLPWSADAILTIPSKWQKLFNNSEVEVRERMQEPVAPEIIDELYAWIPDFRRAYDPDGMTVDEFDTYGATVRTLRGFIASYHERSG